MTAKLGYRHGNSAGYQVDKCRCLTCRAWNADRARRAPGQPSVNEERIASVDVARADTSWQEQAACRGLGPDLWYPERGELTHEQKAVCSGCPVRARCLAYAMEAGERFGIWGGASERQRRAWRQKPKELLLIRFRAEQEAREAMEMAG